MIWLIHQPIIVHIYITYFQNVKALFSLNHLYKMKGGGAISVLKEQMFEELCEPLNVLLKEEVTDINNSLTLIYLLNRPKRCETVCRSSSY